MASLRVGHVYVIHTTLTRPEPKDKITVCVSAGDGYFVWFNSEPPHHGVGQLPCGESDHNALSKECFLDLSRITFFGEAEVSTARDRGPVSDELRDRILAVIDAGIETLPPRHAQILRDAFSNPLEPDEN